MIVYKTQLSSMNQFSDMLNIKPEITWIEFHFKLIFFIKTISFYFFNKKKQVGRWIHSSTFGPSQTTVWVL